MGLIKISNKALRMFVGIGSRSHDFDADFIMIILTSSSDAGSKLKKLFLILGFWTDGTSSTWFEKLARIVLILSQKYFAKCSQRDFTLFDSGSAAAGVLCKILLMVSQRRRGFSEFSSMKFEKYWDLASVIRRLHKFWYLSGDWTKTFLIIHNALSSHPHLIICTSLDHGLHCF